MIKNKAFTLIELLAVIAILAIVLLIAVPKVISTVENTKIGAFKSSSQMLIRAIDLKMAEEPNFDYEDLNKTNLKEKLGIDGSNYDSLTVTKVDGKIQVNIVGQGSWKNLQANGTLEALTVTKGTIAPPVIPVFSYTGEEQTFIVPVTGTYKIELWGVGNTEETYGKGGYVSGLIKLTKSTALHIYVGAYANTFNGGGNSRTVSRFGEIADGLGNGSTDIRLSGGNWSNADGLRSRIIVAGAGGRSNSLLLGEKSGVATIMGGPAHGGGLEGYQGTYGYNSCCYTIREGFKSTQTTGGTGGESGYSSSSLGGNGSFGIGGLGGYWCTYFGNYDAYDGYGGSGGYYGSGGSGGGAVGYWSPQGTSGASSFISGHTGGVAITSSTDATPKTGCTTGTTDASCSHHYSGKIFTDTVMIDGNGYNWTNIKGSQIQMPKPDDSLYPLGMGHAGNGVAKITFVSSN